MSIRRINGFQLEKMVRSGLANLQNAEEELNRLNVFPVADGDTGTNMCLTLANGIRQAESHGDAGLYMRDLSSGMLLGARGNSGVILSQLFRGMAQELAGAPLIGPGEMRNALIRAYRTAYSVVVQPVEGTILTVAREGIEHIRSQISRRTGIDTILSMYIAEMRKTLSYTPELLSVLKEAGVVDSGALGYITICEGMLRSLYGEDLKPQLAEEAGKETAASASDTSLFNENSSFEDGYCMEFILQLMKDERYTQRFRLERYIDDLKEYGESLVVVQDGTRVKVHIHTHRPEKIIRISREFGEFVTFKLENMQLQHNEQQHGKAAAGPKIPLASVAVINGEGMRECCVRLGCGALVDGGSTMNPSAQDFLKAFRSLRAECIAVLPNNPNAILAAEQAAAMVDDCRVAVLPSRSMAEGYFALAMDVADSTDADFRLRQMSAGIKGVLTFGLTTASRDCKGEISCRKGQQIVMLDDSLIAAGEEPVSCLLAAMEKVPEAEEKETCLLFRGEGAEEDESEALWEALSARYPLMDIQELEGGQALYRWLIGLS